MIHSLEAWFKRDKPTLIWLSVLTFLLAGVTMPVEHPRRQSKSETATAQQVAEPKRSTESQQPKTEQRAADPAGVSPLAEPTHALEPADKKLSKADIYKRSCNTPENYQEADLCEQRRMADTADANLTWMKIQTVVGGIGLAFVFGGLVTSAVSAWTSARSTNIARKALQMAQGAILDFIGFKVQWHAAQRRFDIEIRIKNTGKSVAIIDGVYLKYLVGSDLPSNPVFNLNEGRRYARELLPEEELVLEADPDRPIILNSADFVAVLTRQKKFFVYGVVVYKNVFETTFERGYAREIIVDQPGPGQYRHSLDFPVQVMSQARKYNFFREQDKRRAFR